MIAGPIEIRPIASHPITACLVTAQVNSSHHKNSFNFEAFLRLLGETIHSPHTEERTCWCLSSQVHRANRGSLAGKKLSSWSLKHTYTQREKLLVRIDQVTLRPPGNTVCTKLKFGASIGSHSSAHSRRLRFLERGLVSQCLAITCGYS